MARLTPEARDLIVRVMLGEDGESPEGMTGVAHVIKNRLDSGYADSAHVGPVIHARGQFDSVGGKIFNSASPNDPKYQRAAAIADSVFDGQTPDNTGGATSFYAPGAMSQPNWAQGKQGLKVGNQLFYKLPMNAALVGGGGQGPAPTGPAMGASPTGPSSPMTGGGAPIQAFTGGDYGRSATAAQQPFKGIVIHVTGKPTLQSELDYSSHSDPNRPGFYGYHYIVDRDGKVYQAAPDNVRTNHIMPNSQYGLNNSNAIGVAFVGADKGTTPEQMAAGKALVGQLQSKYNIDPKMVVSHGELDPPHGKGLNPGGGEEGQDFITAWRNGPGDAAGPASSASPAAAASAPVPAANAQPASATAPGSSGGGFAVPPAGAYPGSDKYSVIQGMTTGTSHNPQLTTAANWGNLFGGAASPAAPAGAPAAASPSPPQPAPIGGGAGNVLEAPTGTPADSIDKNTPLPWAAPPDRGPGSSTAPAAAASPPAPAPMAVSVAAPADAPDSPTNNPLPWRASGPGHYPVWGPRHAGGTPSGPIIDSPSAPAPTPTPQAPPDAQPPRTYEHQWDAPISMNQPANLPGSMFASAQNLLKLLFPTA